MQQHHHRAITRMLESIIKVHGHPISVPPTTSNKVLWVRSGVKWAVPLSIPRCLRSLRAVTTKLVAHSNACQGWIGGGGPCADLLHRFRSLFFLAGLQWCGTILHDDGLTDWCNCRRTCKVLS
ncbi:hypothetical protein B0T26DRAFT_713671 [Lasiosphaeria miniovina]|uniref:Uncharacterized protein n=1 Tax=Lasiosphaeria miniovina TaxID=1954250 RepID=A0AA40AMP6_9PEZI|nr:uncharacterized protein B0T26DRAFT_713671 [Lasiosphaeria miniovina]KAK0718590.1 hypothetical protein B0T26DRAFT_713671 [Lasiosphaeria miniovina]